MPIDLEDRGRALENEYFHRKEQELIEKLKAHMAVEQAHDAGIDCPRCGHVFGNAHVGRAARVAHRLREYRQPDTCSHDRPAARTRRAGVGRCLRRAADSPPPH